MSEDKKPAESHILYAVEMLKSFFKDIRPHINGHNKAMERFFKAIDVLEKLPTTPTNVQEQDELWEELIKVI